MESPHRTWSTFFWRKRWRHCGGKVSFHASSTSHRPWAGTRTRTRRSACDWPLEPLYANSNAARLKLDALHTTLGAREVGWWPRQSASPRASWRPWTSVRITTAAPGLVDGDVLKLWTCRSTPTAARTYRRWRHLRRWPRAETLASSVGEDLWACVSAPRSVACLSWGSQLTAPQSVMLLFQWLFTWCACLRA